MIERDLLVGNVKKILVKTAEGHDRSWKRDFFRTGTTHTKAESH